MTFIELAAVIGPLLGVTIGAGLSNIGDSQRWRRTWLITQVAERRKYMIDVTRAVDGQMLIVGLCVQAARGQRPPVEQQRVADADSMWHDVLACRYISANDATQHALAAFDTARAAVVNAVNDEDTEQTEAAELALDHARLVVLDGLQHEVNDLNQALSEHVLPWSTVHWAMIRGRSLPVPVAPLPSSFTAQ